MEIKQTFLKFEVNNLNNHLNISTFQILSYRNFTSNHLIIEPQKNHKISFKITCVSEIMLNNWMWSILGSLGLVVFLKNSNLRKTLFSNPFRLNQVFERVQTVGSQPRVVCCVSNFTPYQTKCARRKFSKILDVFPVVVKLYLSILGILHCFHCS